MSFSVLGDWKQTLLSWAPQLNSQFNDLRENRNVIILDRDVPLDLVWIEEGKRRRGYRRTFFIESLPNSTQVFIPHSVEYSRIVDIWGIAFNGENSLPLVFSNIEMYMQPDNLVISTTVNRTAYSAYIHVDFLK